MEKFKWFNATKGYGYVTMDSGADIFVHYQSIGGPRSRSVNQGESVSFKVTHGSYGMQANKVMVED
jgi:CspA family cold shock protein